MQFLHTHCLIKGPIMVGPREKVSILGFSDGRKIRLGSICYKQSTERVSKCFVSKSKSCPLLSPLAEGRGEGSRCSMRPCERPLANQLRLKGYLSIVLFLQNEITNFGIIVTRSIFPEIKTATSRESHLHYPKLLRWSHFRKQVYLLTVELLAC